MITVICTCIHRHYHYISVCCDFTCLTLLGSALYWWMSKNATSPWPCLTASAKGVYPFYNRTVLTINNCVTIILGQTKVIIITYDTICYSYLVNLGASNNNIIKISVVPYSGLIMREKLFVDEIVKTFHRYRFEDYN